LRENLLDEMIKIRNEFRAYKKNMKLD